MMVTSMGTPPCLAQTSEGIAVRGHWQLTVRDPNGAITQRIAFDNHLTSWGAAALVQVLIGNQRFDWWQVGLVAVPRVQTQEVFGPDSQGVALIYPAGKQPPEGLGLANGFAALRSGLALDEPRMGHFVQMLELAGSATTTHAGVVTHVATLPNVCTAPGNCRSDFAFTRTAVPDSTPPTFPDGTVMPDGLRVEPGQTIEVTVRISFPYPDPTLPR
jgi:hypothetical protein